MSTVVRVDEGVEVRLRLACADLDRRLRAGEAACAEDYFSIDPSLFRDTEAALELVYAEFVIRGELNQNPGPAEWYARFPQWQARLQRLFEVHDIVAPTAPLDE